MVYSMFPLNQGAEGNDFKDPKSGEIQQDKGFHTSSHPILRLKSFCCFFLYFKQVEKGRDSSILKKTKVIWSSVCPQNTNTQKQGKDGTPSQAAL